MTHQIKLVPSNHTFEADENESLLDAALRSGLNISYSCTTGGCGECKAQVESYPNAEYKAFFSRQLAERAFKGSYQEYINFRELEPLRSRSLYGRVATGKIKSGWPLTRMVSPRNPFICSILLPDK